MEPRHEIKPWDFQHLLVVADVRGVDRVLVWGGLGRMASLQGTYPQASASLPFSLLLPFLPDPAAFSLLS